MYSRNFAKFETVSPPKAENIQVNQGIRKYDKTIAIPIKSYSDNSAIEVFNRLGENNNNNTTQEAELQVENISSNILSAEEASEEKDVALTEKKENEKTYSIFKDFHKLIDIIDDDWFIVLLAFSLFIFGRNETNDKLTPIALLAIMFI